MVAQYLVEINENEMYYKKGLRREFLLKIIFNQSERWNFESQTILKSTLLIQLEQLKGNVSASLITLHCNSVHEGVVRERYMPANNLSSELGKEVSYKNFIFTILY